MDFILTLESDVRINVCGNQTETYLTTSISIWRSTLSMAVYALPQDTMTCLSRHYRLWITNAKQNKNVSVSIVYDSHCQLQDFR